MAYGLSLMMTCSFAFARGTAVAVRHLTSRARHGVCMSLAFNLCDEPLLAATGTDGTGQSILPQLDNLLRPRRARQPLQSPAQATAALHPPAHAASLSDASGNGARPCNPSYYDHVYCLVIPASDRSGWRALTTATASLVAALLDQMRGTNASSASAASDPVTSAYKVDRGSSLGRAGLVSRGPRMTCNG
jgi:hypothetical protein